VEMSLLDCRREETFGITFLFIFSLLNRRDLTGGNVMQHAAFFCPPLDDPFSPSTKIRGLS